ncbi:MAG: hypothetical protein ABI134_31495 [Byssovorax sp.]
MCAFKKSGSRVISAFSTPLALPSASVLLCSAVVAGQAWLPAQLGVPVRANWNQYSLTLSAKAWSAGVKAIRALAVGGDVGGGA